MLSGTVVVFVMGTTIIALLVVTAFIDHFARYPVVPWLLFIFTLIFLVLTIMEFRNDLDSRAHLGREVPTYEGR